MEGFCFENYKKEKSPDAWCGAGLWSHLFFTHWSLRIQEILQMMA